MEKEMWYASENGLIKSIIGPFYKHPNNAISKKQVEKILALNKLINVAKYLNGDWEPNFHDITQVKYYIYLNENHIRIEDWFSINLGIPCFKSKELATQAIEILGEKTIRLTLS